MRPEHFVCQHVNSIVRRVIGHIELFLNHAPLFLYLGFVNQWVANHVDENVESLTITLDYPKEDPTNITLRVVWGKLQLTAPIEVMGID